MKLRNRILALILSILIVSISLVGCQVGIDSVDSTPAASTPTASTPAESTPTASKPAESTPNYNIDFSSDPYADMTAEVFYATYTPAVSYEDAYYRTQHYFMSGSIDEQDQAPTIAENQPTEDGMLVRNTSAIYEDDGKTYVVLEADGDVAFKVYKGGAYVTLEEVAAYVYAFGDVPSNYVASKNAKPATSPWGKYLRLNHSKFSGSTSKYPYEPELPNISGCGGDLFYYEIDIGTTGTDCDPNYAIRDYNDGYTITRGAARIVYTRFDKNNNSIIDPNEKYVFYTYNHYNDFREWLNYEGGWGEMFGNITGGGTLSSKTHYNPTRYVRVARRDFSADGTTTVSAFYFFDSAKTESILASLFSKNAA